MNNTLPLKPTVNILSAYLKLRPALNKTLHEKKMSVAKEFRRPKPQKLTKSQDMTHATFSKLTGTFKLHQ